MKVVLLAGGYGTRLSEETMLKPKPMVEIGGKPILWHIMKMYSAYGLNDFIICCGYKGFMIKEYFANYFLHTSDVTFDMVENTTQIHTTHAEPWRVTLVDTGEDTMTGGRLKAIQKYVAADECFCMTYGDGVSDVNIPSLIDFHLTQGKLATVTAVQPPGRFGALDIDRATGLSDFVEKPKGDGAWINGGFFVLSPAVLDYIDGPHVVLEQSPLRRLSAEQQLIAYQHTGFWYAMDTLREKKVLEDLWQSECPPWKVW